MNRFEKYINREGGLYVQSPFFCRFVTLVVKSYIVFGWDLIAVDLE